MNFKLVLILILSSLTVVFIAQNVAMVEISFMLWKASLSSALLIFFTLLIGLVLGWFLHGYFLHRKSLRTVYLR